MVWRVDWGRRRRPGLLVDRPGRSRKGLCRLGRSSVIAAADKVSSHWSRAMKVAHRIRVAYVKSIEWLGLMEFDLVGTSPQKLDTLVNRHFRQCAKRHHPDHHMSKPAAHQGGTRREICKLQVCSCFSQGGPPKVWQHRIQSS